MYVEDELGVCHILVWHKGHEYILSLRYVRPFTRCSKLHFLVFIFPIDTNRWKWSKTLRHVLHHIGTKVSVLDMYFCSYKVLRNTLVLIYSMLTQILSYFRSSPNLFTFFVVLLRVLIVLLIFRLYKRFDRSIIWCDISIKTWFNCILRVVLHKFTSFFTYYTTYRPDIHIDIVNSFTFLRQLCTRWKNDNKPLARPFFTQACVGHIRRWEGNH